MCGRTAAQISVQASLLQERRLYKHLSFRTETWALFSELFPTCRCSVAFHSPVPEGPAMLKLDTNVAAVSA